ncbi:MAG: inorganic phosphate transporter [Acidobacteriota bacterium]
MGAALATAVYLSAGLLLGWSLGANDAANVYGAAVGARMIRFRTAVLACGAFVVLGAVLQGAGAAATLDRLGGIDRLPAAFSVALAAGAAVVWMSRLGLPVSTSQAIVGAIVAWNVFAGRPTDLGELGRIVASWVASPVLAGAMSAGLYVLLKAVIRRSRVHLFRFDAGLRAGLHVAGALGAYALGANNVANVMGVFVSAVPLAPLRVGGVVLLDGAQQLFLLGGLAIAVGVATGSRRVMETVGRQLLRLSPEAAMVVVAASGLTMFVFSSRALSDAVAAIGLFRIPLVPVSSTQAVVGAVLGIGIVRGGRGLRFRVLGEIAAGWVATPVAAALIAFVVLHVVRNVFGAAM